VSAWFASERWAFARHKGQKWLSDVLSDFYDHNWLVSGFARLVLAFVGLAQSFGASLSRFFSGLYETGRLRLARKSQQEANDPEICSITVDPNNEEVKNSLLRRVSDATTATKLSEPALSLLQIPGAISPGPASPKDMDHAHLSDGEASMSSSGPTVGKQLWKTAIRNIKMQNAGEKAFALAPSPPTASFSDKIFDSPQSSSDELAKPSRKRTTSSGFGRNMPERRRTVEQPLSARSKLNLMTTKLSELVVNFDLAPHTALVRQMQFSPDGRFLATASWDKTSVIFRVGVSSFIPS
jgi:WD40 repeat protein